MRMLRNEQGETLVEVIMALAILSLVLTSAYVIATRSFRQGRGAGERTQAANYLQEQAEALRSFRDANPWSTFTSAVKAGSASGGFCLKQGTNLAGQAAWTVVDDNDAACNKAGIELTILATADDVAGKVPADAYRFTLTAQWSTGPDQNTTQVITTLTNPGAKP